MRQIACAVSIYFSNAIYIFARPLRKRGETMGTMHMTLWAPMLIGTQRGWWITCWKNRASTLSTQQSSMAVSCEAAGRWRHVANIWVANQTLCLTKLPTKHCVLQSYQQWDWRETSIILLKSRKGLQGAVELFQRNLFHFIAFRELQIFLCEATMELYMLASKL